MNPQRAQMLREIRKEHCEGCIYKNPECSYDACEGFKLYLEDLFAEAENLTEKGA